MIIRLFQATSLVLLSLTVSVHAEESSTMVRAVLHDPSKPDAQFFYGKVGESMLALKLSEEGLAEPQKLPVENGSLNLFTSSKVDKNNPQASLAATIKVAPGQSRVILIILPAGQGTPPYRLVAVPDDPKSFPWGESKAVNLTPVDFAIEAGEHKLPIPSGKVTTVPKVTKLDEYNRAQTNFYYKQGDQWVVAAERQMQYVSALRRVFLVYKSPGALAPDVRTIVDNAPPAPAP